MPRTNRKPRIIPDLGRGCDDCGGTDHSEVYCRGRGILTCGHCGRPQRDHDLMAEPCFYGIREGMLK